MTPRVLLADDQALFREGLETLLSVHKDIQVVGQAVNGQEAVDIALKLRPDVILMDLMMPGINGLEATRRLRAGGFTGGIIMVSIQNEQEYVQSAIAAGAEAFVAKDKFCDEIENVIRRVIDSKR